APLDMRTGDSRQLWLRPFGAGLLDSRDVSTSMMAFVLLLLAAVLYDGALATPEWGKLEGAIAPYVSTLGDLRLVTIRTAGRIAFSPIFCRAFVGGRAVMTAVTPQLPSPPTIARSFVLSLVT